MSINWSRNAYSLVDPRQARVIVLDSNRRQLIHWYRQPGGANEPIRYKTSPNKAASQVSFATWQADGRKEVWIGCGAIGVHRTSSIPNLVAAFLHLTLPSHA